MPFRNHILSSLSGDDFQRLELDLDAVALPVRTQLQASKKRVEQVYFVESGVASVGRNGKHGIDIALIGREGMTGLSVVLGGDDAPTNDIRMQIAGSGYRVAADDLRDAMSASLTLNSALLRYAHSFMNQAVETAISNGRSKIEQRLSRWLLMTADRIHGNEIALTHEVLAAMIGVQRPGLTVALQELERRSLITYRRGFITIIDRDGLKENSNGTYSRIKKATSGDGQ